MKEETGGREGGPETEKKAREKKEMEETEERRKMREARKRRRCELEEERK